MQHVSVQQRTASQHDKTCRCFLVLVKSFLGKVKVLKLFELMHLVLRNQLTCQFETCSCIVLKGNTSKLSHGKPCRHGIWRRFQINLSDFARAKYGLLCTIVSRECPFECVCRQKYAGMQSVWYLGTCVEFEPPRGTLVLHTYVGNTQFQIPIILRRDHRVETRRRHWG